MKETLFQQAYTSPLSYGPKDRASYNPFVDVMYLPFCFSSLSEPTKTRLQLQSFELGHHYLSLKGPRLALKKILPLIYKGIYSYITNEKTPPLKVPTFRNAPGLNLLNLELSLIFRLSEPIEEILTLARTVSLFENSEDPFALKKRGKSFPGSPNPAQIELEGLNHIAKEFGKSYVELYEQIMDVTNRELMLIYEIINYLLPLPTRSTLFDDDFNNSKYLTEVGQEMVQGGKGGKTLPDGWYRKELLTREGKEELLKLYLYSTGSFYNRFKGAVNYLQREKANSEVWEDSEVLEALLKMGAKDSRRETVKSLADSIIYATALIEGRKRRKQEKKPIKDHFVTDAMDLTLISSAYMLIEHKDIYGYLSPIARPNVLQAIKKTAEIPNLPSNYFLDKLKNPNSNPPAETITDKLQCTLLLDKDNNVFPGKIMNFYKPKYVWESIRQRLATMDRKQDFKIPWDDKVSSELEELIRENIEIDPEGLKFVNGWPPVGES